MTFLGSTSNFVTLFFLKECFFFSAWFVILLIFRDTSVIAEKFCGEEKYREGNPAFDIEK